MKIIEELEKSIAESIDMDKKSTFSTRLYNIVGLWCSVAAFILLLTTGIGFLANFKTGIKIWMWVFYFVMIFNIAGLYFSISQRLRGRYFSANFSILLGALCFLTIIAFVVIQIVKCGKVYIFPFQTPPV